MNSTPELFGISVAVLALIVAGAGFLVSLFTLGWQISKHMLDGGRVRIYLNAATWEPGVKLTTNNTGQWQMDIGTFGQVAKENIELAQLVVENPGRTAVTIHRPGLSIAMKGKTERFIVPRMFKLDDFGSDTATAETVVRIDPYDRITFLLDYWSVIPDHLHVPPGTDVTVRGSVLVAGHKRPRRSPRSRAWKIPAGAWTAYRDGESISPFTVMWRVLCRSHLGGRKPHSDTSDYSITELGEILFQAMRKFEERPSSDELVAALREAATEWEVSPLPIATLSWQMLESLDRHESHLGKWPYRSIASDPRDPDGNQRQRQLG
ncbi:hypothetical protein [Streptomyces sp. 1222.2]|uniref:hypothetical protein n=1 Tax=Streptomyces sp. 1222.2 TaxID=1938833 RepID=UPI0011811B76|nr:hypothetical protein [Streptomyces sp. 1222.2]